MDRTYRSEGRKTPAIGSSGPRVVGVFCWQEYPFRSCPQQPVRVLGWPRGRTPRRTGRRKVQPVYPVGAERDGPYLGILRQGSNHQARSPSAGGQTQKSPQYKLGAKRADGVKVLSPARDSGMRIHYSTVPLSRTFPASGITGTSGRVQKGAPSGELGAQSTARHLRQRSLLRRRENLLGRTAGGQAKKFPRSEPGEEIGMSR